MLERICIAVMLAAGFFLSSMYVQAEEQSLSINSESVIVMDAKSGKVLYKKNEEQQMYPASITKIATAIYAIENSDLDDIVTISESAANSGGSSVFLEVGEEIPMEQLIIGMLINSGNDATAAIAEHIDGSFEQFSENINNYLKEKANTKSTSFMNPHGLFDENHMTTAIDMAKITQYAMKNEIFREMFQMKTYDWSGKSWETVIVNHHRIVKGEYPYEGVTGGKTGYVPQAGFTLVTTAERDGMELIAVTLNAWDDDITYNDTIKLLDYGFVNFETNYIEKNKEYQNGDNSYILPEDIYYTVEKGTEIKEETTQDGTLIIKDESGEEITAIELEPVVTAAGKSVDVAIEDEKKEEANFSLLEIALAVISLLLAAVILFYIFRSTINKEN